MKEAKLKRTTFSTSRTMDFFSEKELVAQCGHRKSDWPIVILKELVDNSLDACEEAGLAPEIEINVDDDGIAVSDNGPGIPSETVEKLLDYNIRVSSREAYVAPSRGAQGNALKTILAMPHVLDGDCGRVVIEAPVGVRPVEYDDRPDLQGRPARAAPDHQAVATLGRGAQLESTRLVESGADGLAPTTENRPE